MEFMAFDIAYKLSLGVMILLFIRILLKVKDTHILGINNFKEEVLPKILSNPIATSIYFVGFGACICYVIVKILVG